MKMMKNKKAIIFGITGQDGSYLSELLLKEGYAVYGVSRRVSSDNTDRITHLVENKNFFLVPGDITDPNSIGRIIRLVKPNEVYNLAAQSHVGISFNEPGHTFAVTAKGCLNILEAIREFAPDTRFYQASSSEMFGNSVLPPSSLLIPKVIRQDEDTSFVPQSPYAIAKVAAHHFTQLYRKSYNLHASCGILFNHESERRGKQFVSRKITSYIGQTFGAGRLTESIYMHDDPREQEYLQRCPKLGLGNLTALRDWGHAEDYVYAMWLMLQQDEPDDYVIGTGETHTVEEFLIEAFGCINKNYKDFVFQDPKFFRPADVAYLCADYSKAKAKLGWEPKISFKQLVERMVRHDLMNLNFANSNKSVQDSSQVRISER